MTIIEKNMREKSVFWDQVNNLSPPPQLLLGGR